MAYSVNAVLIAESCPMMMYCFENDSFFSSDGDPSLPQLLFVCKTEGEESAIPRVMHKHNERLELMFIVRGSGDYIIGDRAYMAQQGDILVFDAGVVHDERPHLSEDSLIYSCGIKNLRLSDLPENTLTSSQQAAVVSSGSQCDYLKSMFDILAHQCSQKEANYGAVSQHLLSAIVVLCKNLFDTQHQLMNTPEMSLGLRIKAFIDEHYMENISLDSIADEVGMNRFYLSHTFKKFAGYSPKQYLIRRRVGEAQSLLLGTSHSVSDISIMVGYDNVNNFYKVFKQVVGMPPSQYKHIWGGDVNPEAAEINRAP